MFVLVSHFTPSSGSYTIVSLSLRFRATWWHEPELWVRRRLARRRKGRGTGTHAFVRGKGH